MLLRVRGFGGDLAVKLVERLDSDVGQRVVASLERSIDLV